MKQASNKKLKSPTFFHEDRPFYQNEQQYYYPDILKLIQPVTKVLDLGCGRGALSQQIKDKLLCDIICVDASPEAGKVCKKRGLAFVQGDIEGGLSSLPKDFHYVVIAAALEHVLDAKETLLEIKDRLRKDGTAIVVVPNFSFWIWRLHYLRGKNAKRFKHPPTKDDPFVGVQSDGHTQFFTKEALTHLLTLCGYSDITCTGTRPRTNPAFLPKKVLLKVYNRLPNLVLLSPLLIATGRKPH